MVTNEKHQVKLVRQKANTFRHVFEEKIHFGTTYKFYVKTDDPDSVASASVNVTTISIPVPETLTFHPGNNFREC